MKQYINNISIHYNGTNLTTQNNYLSYFTDNEKTIIETFLKNTYNYRSTYYDILTELHKLEKFISDRLEILINQEYFWNNINDTINEIAKGFKSTYNWEYYNNTLMIKSTDYEINLNPDLFENGKRKYYLSRNITITNGTIVGISRNINDNNNNILNFINGTVNLDDLMMDNILTFIKNLNINRLKSSDNEIFINNTLFNHKYNNGIKYFINKNIKAFLDDNVNGLNKLNSNFYDLMFKQIINEKNSGFYLDDNFNEKYFGLDSNCKIQLNDFSDNEYFITELNLNKNIINENKTNINTISNDRIFNYNIVFDDDTNKMLDSNNKYYIELDENIDINKPKIFSDSLNFYSDKLIKDETNISILVNENYNINSYTNYGINYEITTSDILKINNDSKLYYNGKQIKLLNSSTTKLTIIIDSINTSTHNYIYVYDDVKLIKSTKGTGKTVLELSNNISNIFTNESYFEYNDTNYLLKYDGTSYYIENELDIRKNRLYRILKFIKINTTTDKSSYISEIELDKNIDDYFYYNNNDNINLDEVNFMNDNLSITRADIIGNKKLRIYYKNNILTDSFIKKIL